MQTSMLPGTAMGRRCRLLIENGRTTARRVACKPVCVAEKSADGSTVREVDLTEAPDQPHCIEEATSQWIAAGDPASISEPKSDVEDSSDMGTIVEPSASNKGGIRGLAIAAAVLAGSWGCTQLPNALAVSCHVAAAGTWLGVNIWTTFFAGITMFKNLPRQTFGKLQAKLFPMYFALISACCLVLLATTKVGVMSAAATPKVTGVLALGLVTALSNLLFIEPKATSVLFKRYELENSGNAEPEARKALTKSFGALHGLSSVANLGNLAASFAHTVWLGALVAQQFV